MTNNYCGDREKVVSREGRNFWLPGEKAGTCGHTSAFACHSANHTMGNYWVDLTGTVC